MYFCERKQNHENVHFSLKKKIPLDILLSNAMAFHTFWGGSMQTQFCKTKNELFLNKHTIFSLFSRKYEQSN